jgi:hypothetical protein
MSLQDAARAVEAFLGAVREAQAVSSSGEVGRDLDDLLRHAKTLLDVMDEELLVFNRAETPELFAAALALRQKLKRLRDELRGDSAH